MAIKTKKLTEVSVLDQATEQTNVLVEHDGKTMRLPLGGLGIAQLLERIEALENRENNTPDSSLITFTVDGKQYQAEQGMTWGQFVESEYNPVVVCSGCGEEKKTFWNKGTTIGGPIDGLCEDCDEMGGNVGDDQCIEYMSPSDPIWATYSYTIG